MANNKIQETPADTMAFIRKCLDLLDTELTRMSNREKPTMTAEALLCPVLNAKAALDRLDTAFEKKDLLRVPVEVWNMMAHKVESADALRNALENLTRFTESDIRGLENLARYAMCNSVYGGGILQALTGAIREGKRVMEGGVV